ncbi:MAG: phosphoglucosamine mutase [Dehalococcoidales bacterium]|nr:MAG: phosphoglucosamine mutase [Dehalococcoidales bacterium]
MKLFGTSGIRRIADGSLVELALKAGMVAGKLYGDIVVGGDTRTSTEALKYAFISGALISGADCTDVGLVPTPTLAIAAEKSRAGVMITASHNPPEYNGLKFINPDGSAFNLTQQTQIEEMILTGEQSSVNWDSFGNLRTSEDAVNNHIDRILSNITGQFKVRVVLDCGGGAASVITPVLLRKMGCEVIELNCVPRGDFTRPSEPTEENLQELIRITGEAGADLGIAHDGDADRMMAVDDKGRFIPGDKLLVLLAREVDAKKVITTMDASMIIEETGVEVIRTKIGDSFVSVELKNGGEFGGEPSGSWMCPENSLCPDGIYAAARMAALAGRTRISDLVDEIPEYPIQRTSVRVNKLDTTGLEEILMSLNPISTETKDGIKLIFDDSWALIRPSGTEPKIRITVEGKNREILRNLHDTCLVILNEFLK